MPGYNVSDRVKVRMEVDVPVALLVAGLVILFGMYTTDLPALAER